MFCRPCSFKHFPTLDSRHLSFASMEAQTSLKLSGRLTRASACSAKIKRNSMSTTTTFELIKSIENYLDKSRFFSPYFWESIRCLWRFDYLCLKNWSKAVQFLIRIGLFTSYICFYSHKYCNLISPFKLTNLVIAFGISFEFQNSYPFVASDVFLIQSEELFWCAALQKITLAFPEKLFVQLLLLGVGFGHQGPEGQSQTDWEKEFHFVSLLPPTNR